MNTIDINVNPQCVWLWFDWTYGVWAWWDPLQEETET